MEKETKEIGCIIILLIVAIISFLLGAMSVNNQREIDIANKYCQSYGYDHFKEFDYTVFEGSGEIADLVIICGKEDNGVGYSMGQVEFGDKQ